MARTKTRPPGQRRKAAKHARGSIKAAPKRRAARQKTPPRVFCPIVGIGASAGGLDAFQRFFSKMPADSGMAFVLVPHLDAHHKSAMVDLLRSYTRMAVIEITDRAHLEANHVYVIPPNATLSIVHGALHTTTPRSRGMTIDDFFGSLAEDQADNAIGVILSGSGSDGTVGLKAIKEAGGLTFAQAPESSAFDSMPRSAVASGSVDFILPVEDIPARLVEQVRHIAELRQERKLDAFREEVRRNLAKITALVRAKTGHDFAHYKESTCIRRVERRMHVNQVTSVSDYLELLRKNEAEPEALFRDLLIGVTQFFRDSKAFDALKTEVIPKLFENKRADEQIRVWVPACATGEEAYSIAILLHEEMRRRVLSLRVQIFATDIDDQALEIARSGLYPQGAVRDLSDDMLRLYFVKQANAYRITKEIREMCIFSAHNLIKDAPFSKLDLISCRNLLIYFDAALQQRALALFHFGLRQRGYLFLGPAENVAAQPKLFSKVDSRARLFKARAVETGRLPPELPLDVPRSGQISPPVRPAALTTEEAMTRRARRVIEAYGPAAVVIDEHCDVLHFSGRTGRYLQPSPGAASLNLFNIVDAGLRPDLRAAIGRAMSSGERIVRENLRLPAEDGMLLMNIVVEPLPRADGEPRIWVVVFQEVRPARPEPQRYKRAQSDKDELIQHLEAELLSSRERLQATIEELETANEEMKSSNEEFQSVNEELQSSNEELETSKEELQSVNEELETVNAELNAKVESLDRALSDQKNLLENTEIATIFLDGKLRIKSFTSPAAEIFRLIDTDLGRPITDIATRIAYDHLPRDIARVLRSLSQVEQEVTTKDGSTSYIMRILPYRTLANVIDGVVVTFVDITDRKRKEEALARLAAIVANSADAIIGLSPDGGISSWNAAAERIYGFTAEEAIGRPFSMTMAAENQQELRHILDRLRRSTPVTAFETERVTKDGRHIHVSYTSTPIRSPAGKLLAAAVIERDVTRRRQTEEQQKVLLGELNHPVKNALATVLSIASRTRKVTDSLDDYYRAFEGRLRALASTHDLLAKNVWTGADLRQILLAELDPYDGEKQAVRISGRSLFLSSRAAVVFGMIFHELATNAAKYGALSDTTGNVQVRWRVDDDKDAENFVLEWQERGGPAAGADNKRGFGIKFIERSVAYELQGSAELQFDPDGLRVMIRAPAAEVVGETWNGSSGRTAEPG
jgi:two-component system, chemotaxis family, CheB/CheR fusion protein